MTKPPRRVARPAEVGPRTKKFANRLEDHPITLMQASHVDSCNPDAPTARGEYLAWTHDGTDARRISTYSPWVVWLNHRELAFTLAPPAPPHRFQGGMYRAVVDE